MVPSRREIVGYSMRCLGKRKEEKRKTNENVSSRLSGFSVFSLHSVLAALFKGRHWFSQASCLGQTSPIFYFFLHRYFFPILQNLFYIFPVSLQLSSFLLLPLLFSSIWLLIFLRFKTSSPCSSVLLVHIWEKLLHGCIFFRVGFYT